MAQEEDMGGLDSGKEYIYLLPNDGGVSPSDVEKHVKDLGDDEGGDSNQYKEWRLEKEYATLSNLVKSMTGADSSAKALEIKKVNKEILRIIIVYLKEHKGQQPDEIAKPIRSVKMSRIVKDDFDAKLMDNDLGDIKTKYPSIPKDTSITKKTIFQIILAANYMDIPSLLHLGCAKIATLIKGKSPEEIKQILGDDSNDANNNNDDQPESKADDPDA